MIEFLQIVSAIGAPFPAVDQGYLLEARQMQALSLAVHIPLVCFGIAFPALVVFMEWLGQKTGQERYTVIAKRGSKGMITLPKLRDSLRDLKFEVKVEPEVAERARVPIERMVAIG